MGKGKTAHKRRGPRHMSRAHQKRRGTSFGRPRRAITEEEAQEYLDRQKQQRREDDAR